MKIDPTFKGGGGAQTLSEIDEVLVLNLNGEPDQTGDIFPPDCKVELPERVPVTCDFKSGFEHVVGEAKLRLDGPRVFATIALIPERFRANFPAPGIKLYPCIGGRALERDGNLLKRVAIDSIGFSLSGNVDLTIPAIEVKL